MTGRVVASMSITSAISVRRTQTHKHARTHRERTAHTIWMPMPSNLFSSVRLATIAWDFSHTHQTAPECTCIDRQRRMCRASLPRTISRQRRGQHVDGWWIVINLSEYYFILVCTVSKRQCGGWVACFSFVVFPIRKYVVGQQWNLIGFAGMNNKIITYL